MSILARFNKISPLESFQHNKNKIKNPPFYYHQHTKLHVNLTDHHREEDNGKNDQLKIQLVLRGESQQRNKQASE